MASLNGVPEPSRYVAAGFSSAEPQQSSVIESDGPDEATQVINILIVDDEPKNLTVLELILNDPTYRVVRAETADEALIALLRHDFALLVLDIRMPSMSGFELAKIIKERRRNARIPIIFLTAYYNEDQHVIEGYDTGAVDYLHKPVNAAILRSKVAIFAEIYRKQRDLETLNQALSAQVQTRLRVEEQLRQLNASLERRVMERTQHITLLMREVDHRSKNILALVQSIARQTISTQPENFVERFSLRLQSLAASHDLLVKAQWQGIDLRDTFLAQLAHLGDLVGERISLSGPPLMLSSSAAQILGMAAHELATNACKYGALSLEAGKVAVSWRLSDDQLSVEWIENGGPPVCAPRSRGLGSKVIEVVTAKSLDGVAELRFDPSGIQWHLRCPVGRVQEASPKSSQGEQS